MSAVELHCHVEGPPGAPVLLFGGSLGTTLEMWQPQLRALRGRVRAIAFDHRGHGRSPVPPGPYSIDQMGADVLALADRLGVERFSYCGLSIGGMVGIWLAEHAAQRVEALVAICTTAHLPPASNWLERAAAVRSAGSPEAVADAVVARWFTAGFAAAHPELVARHRAMIAATSAEGYAACCEAIAALDLRAQLPAIRAPTLVIAGAQDQATPLEHSRALVQAIPQARLEVLEGAAHLASVERAEEVSRLIAEHVLGERDRSGGRDPSGGQDELAQAGMRVRRQVLGDEHVERSLAGATEFTAPFQEFITRHAWGAVWTRPGLDRRTRSAITLAALTALGREGEIALHVRGALRNGMTAQEIAEVLIHTAVYAGVPAANAAFQIAQRVLDEAGPER